MTMSGSEKDYLEMVNPPLLGVESTSSTTPSTTELPPKPLQKLSKDEELKLIRLEEEGEMYLHQQQQQNNGNIPYWNGYYQPPPSNRYLPYSSTNAQTSSALDNLTGGPSTSDFHPQNLQSQNQKYFSKDTVVIAGDGLSNVPAAVIVQLEKANRTIAAQNIEIERLRAYQNQNVEGQLLKNQISGLEKEMRSSRERFLEQQELLAEMSREMDNLLREKLQMQTSLRETEKKYKKAKTATRELAKILENDMCSTPKVIRGVESDDEDLEYGNSTQDSLFQRSRLMSRQQDSNQLKAKAEKVIEQAEERKRKEAAMKDDNETRELMERVLADNENLLFELDKERRITGSLQDDLEKNRRMILDRDENLEQMRKKLTDADLKSSQCENDLSRTSTDLALERARCDALTLELHELDAIFSQTQSTVQILAIENEEMEEKCRAANQTIMTLNAKLEAQGIDLVTTKKTLRAFREASSTSSSNQKRTGPL